MKNSGKKYKPRMLYKDTVLASNIPLTMKNLKTKYNPVKKIPSSPKSRKFNDGSPLTLMLIPPPMRPNRNN
jgi:hypothetical protein